MKKVPKLKNIATPPRPRSLHSFCSRRLGNKICLSTRIKLCHFLQFNSPKVCPLMVTVPTTGCACAILSGYMWVWCRSYRRELHRGSRAVDRKLPLGRRPGIVDSAGLRPGQAVIDYRVRVVILELGLFRLLHRCSDCIEHLRMRFQTIYGSFCWFASMRSVNGNFCTFPDDSHLSYRIKIFLLRQEIGDRR